MHEIEDIYLNVSSHNQYLSTCDDKDSFQYIINNQFNKFCKNLIKIVLMYLIFTACKNYFKSVTKKSPTKNIKSHGIIECSSIRI